MTCPLCEKETFRFYITFCRTHSNTPLIILTEHKPEFTEEDKEMIKKIFPNRKVRWVKQSIPEHAHCHIES